MDMDACAAPAIPDISGAREFNLAALQKKLGKRPACDVRDASEPFHHDCKKHKGRVGQPLRIRGRRVKFLYPFPPTMMTMTTTATMMMSMRRKRRKRRKRRIGSCVNPLRAPTTSAEGP